MKIGLWLVLALMVGSAGSAQEVVSSGNAIERIEYSSPMTLDVPITVLAGLQSKDTVSQTVDLSRYTCDGVSIRSLLITGQRTKKGANLHLTADVFNVPSFDKKATISAEVVAGDRVLGRGARDNIDAEERKVRRRSFTVAVSPVDGVAEVTLHLTVEVRPK